MHDKSGLQAISKLRSRLPLVICFFALVSTLSGCIVVEDGTVGVSKSFGEISDDPLVPGLYPSIPVAREIEVWNIKTQRRSSVIDILSSEGLKVTMETTINFRPVDTVRLRKEVGANFIQVILEPALTSTFRDVVGKRKVEDLITNQEEVTQTAFQMMKKSMEPQGILVERLLLTKVDVPLKFKEAVERKLEQEQKALQKKFELQQAQKDAEIEVARARGAAQAQEIVRSTLSPEYLHYLWISTLNDNPNVIYVATEANMPVFRIEDTAARARLQTKRPLATPVPPADVPQKKAVGDPNAK